MANTSRVIVHPQNKSTKYDIAVVVPCYDEGIGVLDTIYSAVVEASKTESSIGIFLVINNPLGCDEDTLRENEKTAKLVIDIIRNQELGHKKVSGYDYQQRLKIKKIRDLDIGVGFVDCYTPRNAPQECNVGYARDVGTRSILSFLKDESSVIAHTDADCKLLEGYFSGIEEAYFKGEVSISTGERNFIFEESQSNQEDQIIWMEQIERDLSMFGKNHLDDLWNRSITTNFTPGSHMHFTKKLFQEIGGFEKKAGAEDVTFGMRAQKLGYEIHRINSWIDTLCRPSDRTEEGHGFGFAIIRKGYQNKYETLLDGPFYNGILNSCIKIFQACHISNDFNKTLFSSEMKNIFTEDELSLFSEIYEKYMWGEKMKNYSIIDVLPYLEATLRQELRKKYPMKTLPSIISEANSIIDSDEAFKVFAERMDAPDISNVQFDLPSDGQDKDELLEAYCEAGKQKIHTYILLKKTIDFMMSFALQIKDLKERSQLEDISLGDRYDSPQDMYIDMYIFINKYWKKIFCNLTINISGGETLKNVVRLTQIMFSDGDIDPPYIMKISDLDDLLLSLNKNYGFNFPNFLDSFNMKDFLRKFTMEDDV